MVSNSNKKRKSRRKSKKTSTSTYPSTPVSASASTDDETTQQQQQPLLPLTVGVEIEHILVLHHSSRGDPLAYLKQQFALANLPSHTSNDPNALADTNLKYSTWLLTYDSSLNEFIGASTLLAQPELSDRITAANAGEWSTHGIELVSPPLPAPCVTSDKPAVEQAALAPLREYIDVLHGSGPRPTRNHGVFVTSQCGLHVHVGLPDQWAIPLAVLQHLACLLIQYEDVLSSLHHHSRTPFPGMQAQWYASSNRTSFLEDGHLPTCRRGAGRLDMREVNRRIFRPGITVDQLAWFMGAGSALDSNGNMIRTGSWDVGEGSDWERDAGQRQGQATVRSDSINELSTTIASLQITQSSPTIQGEKRNDHVAPAEIGQAQAATPSGKQMPSQPSTDCPGSYYEAGNKYKLTRWNLLTRHPSEGPRTIEFRQAAGSVDAEEIAETVRLYTALMRCAERKANAVAEGSEPEELEQDITEPTLETLLNELQLLKSVRKYWRSRAERVAEENFYTLRDPCTLKDWERCNACAAIQAHRKEKRVTRRKLEKGWRAFLRGNSRAKMLWQKRSSRIGTGTDSWGSWARKQWKQEEKDIKAKPGKWGRFKGKGKRFRPTRKEKSAAKTKARTKARKAAQKLAQKAEQHERARAAEWADEQGGEGHEEDRQRQWGTSWQHQANNTSGTGNPSGAEVAWDQHASDAGYTPVGGW